MIKFESQFRSILAGAQTVWFRLSVHDTLDKAKNLISQFKDQQPANTEYRVIEYVPTVVYEHPEVKR